MKELDCEDGEINLRLVNDAQIREFNSTYLNRDRPTNVISFAMNEGEFCHINPQILGDIILSVETAARDAETGHIDFMDELEFLIIHGLLHLRGYDHHDDQDGIDEETEKMKALERDLFFLLRHYHLD